MELLQSVHFLSVDYRSRTRSRSKQSRKEYWFILVGEGKADGGENLLDRLGGDVSDNLS